MKNKTAISIKDPALRAKLSGKWVFRNGEAITTFEVIDSSRAILKHSLHRKFNGSSEIHDSLWRREDIVEWKLYDSNKLWIGDSLVHKNFMLLKDTLMEIDEPKPGWLSVRMVRETYE